MQLYILEKREISKHDQYDKMVVRAQNERQAREIANYKAQEGEIWLDPTEVSCWKLFQRGEGGVIVASFLAG